MTPEDQRDYFDAEISDLGSELNISEACAADVYYLRTRSRWTQALEEELIALHRAGTPPNVFEFGSTPETQANLARLAGIIMEEKRK
jgi:hypothetical protein